MIELSPRHTQNCKFVHSRYAALRELPQKGVIAEVGVLAGDLSQWFLNHKKPKELHLIDVFYCDDFPGKNRFKKKQNLSFVKKRFENQISDDIVSLHQGYSWNMLSKFEDHYFDLIYIDAAHDYDSVRRDLKESAKKIKLNGSIVMNDYIMYDHLAKSAYGVVQATNEFCVNENWEFDYFAFHPNLFCDVILKKITN